jgi:hypothetical protein
MAASHTSSLFRNNSDRNFTGDTSVWESLKRAISESSGFKRWKLEHTGDQQFQSLSLDVLVHTYLRETLETLAY